MQSSSPPAVKPAVKPAGKMMSRKGLDLDALQAPDKAFQQLQDVQIKYAQHCKSINYLPPNADALGRKYVNQPRQINEAYLTALMVEFIEESGGSAHPSTMAHVGMNMFPSLVKEDTSSSFEFQDFRQIVKAQLKKNPTCFERIGGRGQFALWKLTESEKVRRQRSLNKWKQHGFMSHRNYRGTESPTLNAVLKEYLVKNPGGCSTKLLTNHLLHNWTREPEVENPHYPMDELIELALSTNPAFRNYDRNPQLWELAPSPAKGIAASVERRSNTKVHNVGFGVGTEKRRTANRNAAATSIPLSPSVPSSPIVTTVSRKRKKEKEAEAEWIQCDGCKKWVTTLDDNITDLSLYDDNNPNHLEYYCPGCREEEVGVAAPAPVFVTKKSREARATRRSRLRRGAKSLYGEDDDLDLKQTMELLEKERLTEFREEKTYWKKKGHNWNKQIKEKCRNSERLFTESISHFKKQLLKKETNVETSKQRFDTFFYDQVGHLKGDIAGHRGKR